MEKKLQLKESNELAQQQLEGLKAAFAIVTRLETKVANGEQDAIAVAGAHADEKSELEAQLTGAKALAAHREEENGKLCVDLQVASAKAATLKTDLANHEKRTATEKREIMSELATTNTALNDTRAALGNVTETLSAKLFVADTERDALKAGALASAEATEKLTAALSAAELELATSKAENAELRIDLGDATKAMQAANVELESSQLLTKQIAGLTKAAEESDEEKAKADAELSAITKERDVLAAKVEKLAVDLEHAQRLAQLKIEGLNAAVRSSDAEKAEALSSCKLYTAELATLKPMLARTKMDVAKVREELEDAQLEAAAAAVAAGVNAKLEADLAASQLEVEAGKQEIADLNSKSEASSENAAEVVLRLQADIHTKLKRSSEKLEEATGALDTARTDLTTVKSELQAEREEGRRLTQEVEGLNVAFEAASVEMANAVASSELSTAELTIVKPKLAKAKAELTKVAEELEAAQMEAAAATGAEVTAGLLADLEVSRDATAAAKSEAKAEEQRTAEVTAKMTALSESLKVAAAALQAERDESAIANSQVRAERADNKRLAEQVESVNAALQTANADKAEAETRCELSAEEFVALKYRFDELQADVAKFIREELGGPQLEAAAGNLAAVTSGLQAARDQSATTKLQVCAEREDSKRLAQQLTEAEAEVAKVREELEGAQLMMEAASGIGAEVASGLKDELEASRLEVTGAKLEIVAGKKLLCVTNETLKISSGKLAMATAELQAAHDKAVLQLAELDEARDQTTTTRSQLAEQREMSTQLAAELEVLKSEMDNQLRAARDSAAEVELELAAQLAASEKQRSAAAKAARDSAAEVELERASQLAASEKQRSAAAESHAATISGLDAQLADAEAYAKSMNEAVTEVLKETVDKLSFDLEKANGKVSDLEAALARQQKANASALETAKATLSDAWSVSAHSLESLTTKLSATKKERTKLNADAARLHTELEATQKLAQQQGESLKTALAAARAKEAEALAASEVRTSELEALKPQLVDANTAVVKLNKAKAAFADQLAEVRAESAAAKQATAKMAIKMATERKETQFKLESMKEKLLSVSGDQLEVVRLRLELNKANSTMASPGSETESDDGAARKGVVAVSRATLDAGQKKVVPKANAFGRLAEQLKSAGRGSVGRYANGIPFASVLGVLPIANDQDPSPSLLDSPKRQIDNAVDPRIRKVMDALNVDQDLATALLEDVIETGELCDADKTATKSLPGVVTSAAMSPVKADNTVSDDEALPSPPR